MPISLPLPPPPPRQPKKNQPVGSQAAPEPGKPAPQSRSGAPVKLWAYQARFQPGGHLTGCPFKGNAIIQVPPTGAMFVEGVGTPFLCEAKPKGQPPFPVYLNKDTPTCCGAPSQETVFRVARWNLVGEMPTGSWARWDRFKQTS